jgi:hypothetical protein
MIPKYKITMLGTSGAGKTAYMIGLYRALGLVPVEGFQMRPAGDLKAGAFGYDWFIKNDFDALSLNWPKATTGTPDDEGLTTWQFALDFEDTRICEWEWIDYRGAAMEEGFRRAAAGGEQSKVSQHLQNSDAVLIFGDSIQLVQPKRPLPTIIKNTGADIVNPVFKCTFGLDEKEHPTCKPPKAVVLVLTKAQSNLITDGWADDEYKKLRAMSADAFNAISSYCIRKKAIVRSRVVAVDIAAKGDVTDTITGEPPGKPVGVASPFNCSPSGYRCEAPLFCCFLEFFRREHHKALTEVERNSPSGKSIFQKTLDFFMKTARNKQEAEDQASRFYSAVERLETKVFKESWPL